MLGGSEVEGGVAPLINWHCIEYVRWGNSSEWEMMAFMLEFELGMNNCVSLVMAQAGYVLVVLGNIPIGFSFFFVAFFVLLFFTF